MNGYSTPDSAHSRQAAPPWDDAPPDGELNPRHAAGGRGRPWPRSGPAHQAGPNGFNGSTPPDGLNGATPSAGPNGSTPPGVPTGWQGG
ncbi:MAG TPA: hypothetical protein VGP05_17375, partial [Pseudonocardia sp.]|nr:hypothetical protein [Pseudonocardia sp.]